MYTLFVCLFGLSVCLYPINVKTAKPIGPKFCVGHVPMDDKIFKKFPATKFNFH